MSLYEMRKFVAPEFIFGVGARHCVGYYARNMMAHRVLLVSDNGVINAGWVKDAIADLQEVGIESVLFSDLTPNPKEFEGTDNIEFPGPPLICISTTAGTAADISQFCIIANTPERYKMAIISKSMVPDVALIDPETTLTMDSYLTARTGLDALTHAIEAYVSTASSPIVDVHAIAAIKLIWHNLERAVSKPDYLAARENMLLGSLQAGLAFSNASLGAVHALAHSLGGFLDLPHGECNALLLDHVIRFNMPNCCERYSQIGDAMGIDMRGMSESQRVKRITQEICSLRQRVGIANSLALRGVRTADIPELAQYALHDACLVTNPRHASITDIKAIYSEAM